MKQCTNPNCRFHAGKGKWAKPAQKKQTVVKKEVVYVQAPVVQPKRKIVQKRTQVRVSQDITIPSTEIVTHPTAIGAKDGFIIRLACAKTQVAKTTEEGGKAIWLDTDTRAGRVAINYDTFKIQKFSVHVLPSSKTGVGQMAMWYNRDTFHKSPVGITGASGQPNPVIFGVTERGNLNVPQGMLPNKFLPIRDDTDAALTEEYGAGSISIAWSMETASEVHIMIKYVIVFRGISTYAGQDPKPLPTPAPQPTTQMNRVIQVEGGQAVGWTDLDAAEVRHPDIVPVQDH